MLKIFLVDDEIDIRLGLKAMIERNTVDCTIVGEASDGKMALEALRELNPEVVITDIKMPVMDGIGLIKGIAEAGLNVKVIVLSGYDEYKYVREAMKSGAVDYLIKPIDKSALLELLEKITRKIEDDLQKERQIAQFSHKINNSMEILKEKFLLDFIKGNDLDIQIRTSLEEFGYSFSGVFMLSLLSIDGLINLEKQMYEKFKISANNLLKQLISRVLDTHKIFTYFIAEYDGRLAILVKADADCIHIVYEELYAVINLLKDEFHKRTGFGFIAGISDAYQNTERTCIAYHQAMLALQGRFYNDRDSVLKYCSEENIYGDLAEWSLADNISRLTNYVELGDVINTKKELEIMCKRLREVKPSPARFRELLKFIVANISAVQQEFREAMDNCSSDEFDLIYHIEKEDTLAALVSYITKSFCDIVRLINNERAHRSKKIIEIAKDYINKHYSEDISLKSVADQVHLSPNYFSDLFKNDTGKNFIDFLIEVRINAAKRLLAKPDAKVYEVGHSVGYDDPASFNRVFKKIVTISPVEYKKLIN